MAFNGEGLLVLCPTSKFRAALFQLLTTAYSIYSQLHSARKSRGRLLHPQPEEAQYRGDMVISTWQAFSPFRSINSNKHFVHIVKLPRLFR